jgi:hypothetical protein
MKQEARSRSPNRKHRAVWESAGFPRDERRRFELDNGTAAHAVPLWEDAVSRIAAYPDDDLARYQGRRPTRRASATAWSLRITTTCLIVAGLMVLGDMVLGWTRTFGDVDGRASDPTPIVLFVGEQRLTIPANMFRFENQRNVGPHEHVELAVHFPTLQGYTPERRDDFLDGSSEAPVLYVTIKRRDTATDSAGRLANVYRHFFGDEVLAAPDGLVGHMLNTESGLAGEEVYFEAGSTDPFTTHCLAPDGSGYPAPCLTEIHAGDGMSVQVRFRKGLLPHWAGIKQSVRSLMLGFGVAP